MNQVTLRKKSYTLLTPLLIGLVYLALNGSAGASLWLVTVLILISNTGIYRLQDFLNRPISRSVTYLLISLMLVSLQFTPVSAPHGTSTLFSDSRAALHLSALFFALAASISLHRAGIVRRQKPAYDRVLSVVSPVFAIGGGLLVLTGFIPGFPGSAISSMITGLSLALLVVLLAWVGASLFFRSSHDRQHTLMSLSPAIAIMVYPGLISPLSQLPVVLTPQDPAWLQATGAAGFLVASILLHFHTDRYYADTPDFVQGNPEVSPEAIALDSSHSSVMITDPEGTIEYVNPQTVETTGYTEKELIGQNPRVLKSGLMAEQVYKELWDTIKNGDVWKGELVNRKKNGELYREFAIISPLTDERQRLTNFVAVKENLYYRNRAEAAEAEISAYSRKIESLEKELKYFEDLYGASSSTITSSAYGQFSLQEGDSESFQHLVEKYSELLHSYLDAQTYRIDFDRESRVQEYVNSLGFFRARPRDVIEIHTSVIKDYVKGMGKQQMSAVMNESRMLVLEVMGYLTSYYRKYFISSGKTTSSKQ